VLTEYPSICHQLYSSFFFFRAKPRRISQSWAPITVSPSSTLISHYIPIYNALHSTTQSCNIQLSQYVKLIAILSCRYFTSQDLRELFTLDDPQKSKTQMQLNKMHAVHRKTDEILNKHIDFLHTLGMLLG